MAVRINSSLLLEKELGLIPFEQRPPWVGGDLQTLRDTFVSEKLPPERGEEILIAIPPIPSKAAGAGYLMALLDLPADIQAIRGLVLLLHGLGGSSRRLGLRRMSFALLQAGFGVLRVNLRGADPGRHLAGGTYAAECNSDLQPVFVRSRQICDLLSEKAKRDKGSLPLFGAGISLGGTMLLNACFGENSFESKKSFLDGLACTSSPLELAACSAFIERSRNTFYQRWLLNRLVRQTLSDPFGVSDRERELLISKGKNKISTIRKFDEAITAPRWGYKDVDAYYLEASPFHKIFKDNSVLPSTLLLQALDDPWVPAHSLQKLEKRIFSQENSNLNVVLTKKGGHNGFHGVKGCWGDSLVAKWFLKLSNEFK